MKTRGCKKSPNKKQAAPKGAACKIFYRETADSAEEPAVWWYNEFVKKQNTTVEYSTPIQLKLPVDLERIIKINDPVYSFSEVMAHEENALSHMTISNFIHSENS